MELKWNIQDKTWNCRIPNAGWIDAALHILQRLQRLTARRELNICTFLAVDVPVFRVSLPQGCYCPTHPTLDNNIRFRFDASLSPFYRTLLPIYGCKFLCVLPFLFTVHSFITRLKSREIFAVCTFSIKLCIRIYRVLNALVSFKVVVNSSWNPLFKRYHNQSNCNDILNGMSHNKPRLESISYSTKTNNEC